jgi:bacterioferritin-associated ferredoxin
MFCDANGRPAPDGDYTLINGRPILRDGRSVTLQVHMIDAKTGAPTTIDEALKATFAEMAKAQGVTVPELLAALSQKQIEEAAASVATKFVSGAAGAGVAARFADSGRFARQLLDAAYSQHQDALTVMSKVAHAKANHRMAQAHRGDAAKPWTAEMQTRAIADAQSAKPAFTYDAAETERLRQAADAAHAKSAAGLNASRKG